MAERHGPADWIGEPLVELKAVADVRFGFVELERAHRKGRPAAEWSINPRDRHGAAEYDKRTRELRREHRTRWARLRELCGEILESYDPDDPGTRRERQKALEALLAVAEKVPEPEPKRRGRQPEIGYEKAAAIFVPLLSEITTRDLAAAILEAPSDWIRCPCPELVEHHLALEIDGEIDGVNALETLSRTLRNRLK